MKGLICFAWGVAVGFMLCQYSDALAEDMGNYGVNDTLVHEFIGENDSDVMFSIKPAGEPHRCFMLVGNGTAFVVAHLGQSRATITLNDVTSRPIKFTTETSVGRLYTFELTGEETLVDVLQRGSVIAQGSIKCRPFPTKLILP